MRIRAIMIRVLQQFKGDKRTMALMIMAPILILTLLYFVFDAGDPTIRYGWVSGPETVKNELAKEKVTFIDVSDTVTEADLENDLKAYKLDAIIKINWPDIQLHVEGSDPSIATRAYMLLIKAISSDAMQDELKDQAIDNFIEKLSATPQGKMIAKQLDSNSNTDSKSDAGLTFERPELTRTFLHGSEEMSLFDNFGSVLLGFFIFFFTFLVAGIAFLRERTTGTLERLLVSPIRRYEVVFGYVAGFGVFTMLQSVLIALYAKYVLNILIVGSIVWILLITVLLAMVALTLGILISTFANNEFQLMQFIPIIIVPQIFFSGLFRMTDWPEALQWIGYLTPLHYASEALRDVMIRGAGFADIALNCAILAGLSIVFMSINILSLKQLRKL